MGHRIEFTAGAYAHLRVYYEVREERDPVVVVKAVGLKDRDRVRIGREEVEL